MSEILILLSSTGKNAELGSELARRVESMGGAARIESLVELELPLYSSKTESAGIPAEAAALATRLSAARALIVLAPEYNGGLPPVLTNAIAWISRSGGDWRAAFNGKLCAIGTVSGGNGLHALAALRQQLSYLGVTVLGRQLCVTREKPLNPDSAEAVVKQLLALSA